MKCIFPSGSLKTQGKETRTAEKLGGLARREDG